MPTYLSSEDSNYDEVVRNMVLKAKMIKISGLPNSFARALLSSEDNN